MKNITSILLVTLACFLSAVIAFLLPHEIGSVCATCTVILAVVDFILCSVSGVFHILRKYSNT